MSGLVFLTRRAPGARIYAHEGLQAAKIAAAFDVPAVLVLMDAGVWHLVGDAGTAHVADLQELRASGFGRIIADAVALHRFAIDVGAAAVPAERCSRAEIAALLAAARAVLTY